MIDTDVKTDPRRNSKTSDHAFLGLHGIKRPVRDVDSPQLQVDRDLYPAQLPHGSKELSIANIFRAQVGFLFVVLKDSKTYLAVIDRAEFPSPGALDETSNVSIRYANGACETLNDFATYHSPLRFRTPTDEETGLWNARGSK